MITTRNAAEKDIILYGNLERKGPASRGKVRVVNGRSTGYEGPIPVDDVLNRVFNFNVEARLIAQLVPCDAAEASEVDASGRPCKWQVIPEKTAIVRTDTDKTYRVAGSQYEIHQYQEWLVRHFENIIDSDLIIGSAGTLKRGGVAFITVELPDAIEPVQGFEVRPQIFADTSHALPRATRYRRVSEVRVCANGTFFVKPDAGLAKFRHNKQAPMRVLAARDALKIVFQMSDELSQQVRELSEIRISDKEWEKLVDTFMPLPELGNDEKSEREHVQAAEARSSLAQLYTADSRVAPWRGSALGVFQAFNTYYQHIEGKDATRVHRNARNLVGNKTATRDQLLLNALKEKS